MLGSEYSSSSGSSFLFFVLSSGGAADFFSSPSFPSASPLLPLSLASGGGGAQGKRGLGRLGFRGCDAGGFIGGAAMAWWGTDADGRPWAFGAVRGRVAASQRGKREARVRRARGRAVKGRARRSPQFVAERRRDGEARRRRAEQAEAASGGWGKSNRGAWQVGPACHRLNERVSGGGDGLVLLGRRMSSRPGPCCLVNWPSAN